MEDYIEDFKYNNCFWQKSKTLYDHAEKKFKEYISVGEMCNAFNENVKNFYNGLNKLIDIYQPCDEG